MNVRLAITLFAATTGCLTLPVIEHPGDQRSARIIFFDERLLARLVVRFIDKYCGLPAPLYLCATHRIDLDQIIHQHCHRHPGTNLVFCDVGALTALQQAGLSPDDPDLVRLESSPVERP